MIRLPLLLAGPTASGKSSAALLIAEQLGGEVVSVDSMQVYRGLDIGTAKPSPEDRKRVPHHLIDVAALDEPFDAAKFRLLALRAVAEIQHRGRVPVLCGGTGLYFKVFLHGLGAAPGMEPGLRQDLERTPLPDLLTELSEKDPATYARIDRKNPRRIFRALEVIRLTGRPYSEQLAPWPGSRHSTPTADAAFSFGIARSPEDLRQRIDLRVEAMFRQGLVAEVRTLLDQGLDRNRTAMQALGYQQVVEHLRGERSLAETVDRVKLRTWRYAKRQLTWFRRQLVLRWIQAKPPDTAHEVAEAIAAQYRAMAQA